MATYVAQIKLHDNHQTCVLREQHGLFRWELTPVDDLLYSGRVAYQEPQNKRLKKDWIFAQLCTLLEMTCRFSMGINSCSYFIRSGKYGMEEQGIHPIPHGLSLTDSDTDRRINCRINRFSSSWNLSTKTTSWDIVVLSHNHGFLLSYHKYDFWGDVISAHWINSTVSNCLYSTENDIFVV